MRKEQYLKYLAERGDGEQEEGEQKHSRRCAENETVGVMGANGEYRECQKKAHERLGELIVCMVTQSSTVSISLDI